MISGAIGRIAITIFAADHGVVDEGVSAYPSAVTAQMGPQPRQRAARDCRAGGVSAINFVITDLGRGGGSRLTAVLCPMP